MEFALFVAKLAIGQETALALTVDSILSKFDKQQKKKTTSKLCQDKGGQYFNRILKVLTRSIGKQKENKRIKIGKKEVKLSLFADDKKVYISDPKNSTRELLQLINTFSNEAGHRNNSKNSEALLYINDKRAEKEIREISPFTQPKIIQKYLG